MSTSSVYRCRHCGTPYPYMTPAVLCELRHEIRGEDVHPSTGRRP